MPRFVLEIGTEEIPPRFFSPALAQLQRDGEEMLKRARLSFGEVKVYGTPRRLVLIAEELAQRQEACTREERGPAARVAFDEDGKPTKAAFGFARRHGVSPDQLEVRDTDQGEYVFAVIREPELPAKDALAPLLPGLISGLSFPKTMRWGTGKLRFARPIRWLLALVDDEVVEFELNGLKSGRLTRGHPTLADGVFEVPSAGDYESALRQRSVLVDPEERGAEIRQQIEVRAQAESARIVDGDLVEETAFLVEWPTAECGKFDVAFLRLPRAVLIEEMQHVQSYFPLENEDGDLLPKFIAVRDGGGEHLNTILTGWQNVLRAKLIDASYFYEQDLKTSLASRIEDLQGVVFQEKLGAMYEKAGRVRKVVRVAADQADLSQDEAKALDRAALLCKADLTTAMVTDLSSLQGLIGREYALASGESKEVADAIGEHYRPRHAGDAIPHTKLGRLLALADKIDTLAALFSIGVVPTGSADPFGLRREASGIVSILAREEADQSLQAALSVGGLLETAVDALREETDVPRPREEVIADVTDFLRQRLVALLRESDVRYDLIEAALAPGVDDLRAAKGRAEALQRLSEEHPDFLPTVIAATRPINISKDFAGAEVDPALFEEDAERELWAAYERVVAQAERVDLVELFDLFSSELRDPIDTYFDDVLVMARDQKLRRNRLAMCWHLTQLFRRIADFSRVVQI